MGEKLMKYTWYFICLPLVLVEGCDRKLYRQLGIIAMFFWIPITVIPVLSISVIGLFILLLEEA